MSNFHASIRDLIEDVHRFLSVSLRNEVLSSSALTNKEKLLISLKNIQFEYPELHLQLVENEDKRSSLCSSASSPPPYIDMNGGSQFRALVLASDAKDNYDECHPSVKCDSLDSPSIAESEEFVSEDAKDLPDVPASELYSCSKSGYLDKRKRESIKGWLNPFQKRWCAMRNGVLYYYEKKTDRKQRGHILLIGYEARTLPDDSKDGKKYNFCFELVCPGKRTYQFCATSEIDMQGWVSAIENYSKISNQRRSSSQLFTSMPKPTAIDSNHGEEEIYEIVDDEPIINFNKITILEAVPNKVEEKPGFNQEALNISSLNYNEWYVGLWDCSGSDDSELNFQRGDMIHVISKEYDAYAWWIGQLQGKVGFVPKSYLMEAFEAY